MKKISLIILALVLFLSHNPSHADVALRSGLRAGSLAVGLENRQLITDDWNWGYGACITGGENVLLGYLSFNKMVTRWLDRYPGYIGIGPVVGLKQNSRGTLGGFAHAGLLNLFNSRQFFLEAGIDVLTGSAGITLQIGYIFGNER